MSFLRKPTVCSQEVCDARFGSHVSCGLYIRQKLKNKPMYEPIRKKYVLIIGLPSTFSTLVYTGLFIKKSKKKTTPREGTADA